MNSDFESLIRDYNFLASIVQGNKLEIEGDIQNNDNKISNFVKSKNIFLRFFSKYFSHAQADSKYMFRKLEILNKACQKELNALDKKKLDPEYKSKVKALHEAMVKANKGLINLVASYENSWLASKRAVADKLKGFIAQEHTAVTKKAQSILKQNPLNAQQSEPPLAKMNKNINMGSPNQSDGKIAQLNPVGHLASASKNIATTKPYEDVLPFLKDAIPLLHKKVKEKNITIPNPRTLKINDETPEQFEKRKKVIYYIKNLINAHENGLIIRDNDLQIIAGLVPLQKDSSKICETLLSYLESKISASSQPVSLRAKQTDLAAAPIAPIRRGGFTNYDGSCFFASALQIFGMVRHVLPQKNRNGEYALDHLPKENREKAKAILEALDTVSKGITYSEEQMKNLREKFPDYQGTNDAEMMFQSLFQLFNIPPLFTYTSVTKEMDPKTKTLITTEKEVNANLLRSEWCEGRPFHVLSENNVSQINIKGSPEYLPVIVERNINIGSPINLAKTLIADDQTEYELVAVRISTGGHAYAYIKENDSWTRYDDNIVTPQLQMSELQREMSLNGKLLMYRKKK